MKKKLTIVWNLILVVFFTLVLLGICPKVVKQFKWLEKAPEGFLRESATMLAYEGVALLILLAAGTFSLSSVFLNKVSWPWRALYLGLLIAAGVGTFLAVKSDFSGSGFVLWTDYMSFLLSAVVIALPILLCGVGYPNLLLRVYHRIRS